MFSFFKSSKKSPAVSPTENKTDENTQKNGDGEYVLVPNSNPATSNNYPPPVYPQFNPNSSPLNPSASPHTHPLNRQFSVTINYTASVPFKLNPSLMKNDNDSEVWNFKIREMNSFIQRINNTDYDFKLERSIIDGRES